MDGGSRQGEVHRVSDGNKRYRSVNSLDGKCASRLVNRFEERAVDAHKRVGERRLAFEVRASAASLH